MIKSIYILIIFFFSFNFLALAKTEFWQCDNMLFKMVMPLIGFDKIYNKKDSLWLQINKFKIDDNEYILYNQNLDKKKCYNSKCKINLHISRIPTSGRFSNYKSIVSNEFCEIDASGMCFKRKVSKNILIGYCSQISKID